MGVQRFLSLGENNEGWMVINKYACQLKKYNS